VLQWVERELGIRPHAFMPSWSQARATQACPPLPDGVELAKQVRERRPDVKVLLVSGYAADALEKAGHRSAELDLLTKPFKRSVVARRIREVLRGNS